MTQRLLAAEFPAKLVRQRLGLQVGHFVHALADLEGRVVRHRRPATPKSIQLFVNDLLDTAIGALMAPATPATCTNTEVVPTEANLGEVRAATLCLINRERVTRGERPLRVNEKLERAAQGRWRCDWHRA